MCFFPAPVGIVVRQKNTTEFGYGEGKKRPEGYWPGAVIIVSGAILYACDFGCARNLTANFSLCGISPRLRFLA